MKNTKLISAALGAVLVCTTLTGCASASANNTQTNGLKQAEPKITSLSDENYSFERDYAFGDFNAHSNADMKRQNGIDTFEDNDIVFEDITYDQLMSLMGKEGNYMIQLSGTWCHNSRAMSPFVNKYAKEYGIKTIYSFDFNLNNGDDGKLFVRQSNEKTTPGTKLNYMYGEMVSRYLDNLDNWIAYPRTHKTALTYTNAAGVETTVGRLQQPIVLVYNKDNTKDYSGKGVDGQKNPIMYAFEEMVERDDKGVYTYEEDADGNNVVDENGKPVRKYITEEYDGRVKEMFQFIKDNNINMDYYTKDQFVRDNFNSYGKEIFSAGNQINIHPVTYRQLQWLLKQDGNSLVMIGGAGSEEARAVISKVNKAAVDKNLVVYMYDPQVDGNQTIRWGYTKPTNILDEDCIASFMYTDLIDASLTNLTVTHSLGDGSAKLISEPFLFSYNKAAKNEDGFTSPIKAWAELTYNFDENSRYYIGKDSVSSACDKNIAAVFDTYEATETVTES